MEGQKTELKMIRMSEVESQEVKWLWYPFIPYGKLTIIQGDPGDGKTTLVLNIAAKLSKGESLDSDMNVQEPVNVIYQTAEDGLADTVKPSLNLQGRTVKRYWLLMKVINLYLWQMKDWKRHLLRQGKSIDIRPDTGISRWWNGYEPGK